MHYAVKITAATAAALMLGAAAMAPAMAQDKPAMAFVANGASDFWKAAEAGMKKAQAELPDYTLEFKYPDQAAVASQQSLMDNLATAGVKAIMVSAVDPKATDVLDKIAGETALFTTDSDAPNSKRIAYIGVTHRTRSMDELRREVQVMREDLWDAVTAGKLALPIDRVFKLDDAEAAQAHMRTNSHFGKIVMVP